MAHVRYCESVWEAESVVQCHNVFKRLSSPIAQGSSTCAQGEGRSHDCRGVQLMNREIVTVVVCTLWRERLWLSWCTACEGRGHYCRVHLVKGEVMTRGVCLVKGKVMTVVVCALWRERSWLSWCVPCEGKGHYCCVRLVKGYDCHGVHLVNGEVTTVVRTLWRERSRLLCAACEGRGHDCCMQLVNGEVTTVVVCAFPMQ